MSVFVVVLDGPSAAGKSTTARAIAERLGLRYLDTGAFYRALALKVAQDGVRPDDAEAVTEVAKRSVIDFSGSPSQAHVFLDGRDVTRRPVELFAWTADVQALVGDSPSLYPAPEIARALSRPEKPVSLSTIYERMRDGMARLKSAVEGARA